MAASTNTPHGTAQRGSIRADRRAACLSQERLAQLAGCSTAYIRLIEAGYEPMHSDVLPRVLEVLGRELCS
ncbi:MAG: helix-turn-helix domain-containing protein [Solirubrobacteraceae bacterium]